MEFVVGKGFPCRVVYGEEEADGVKIAAENLKKDLIRVFGSGVSAEPATTEIRIRTVKDGSMHREQYRMCVRDGKLFIEGSDRRGTIYGIYTFSESIGVSPWYFWADVPVRQKEEYRLPENFVKEDYPTVEYRGIFINDEEELEAWVKNYMGEETIGVKTYEKVFELLLRLKANYIWPAMHVNSFNVKKENGALAEKMGIVVGTSHCDMLMRSNNREWRPWLAKKGYEGVRYDYSEPGRNREVLKEYWRESVEQNRDFEVCYTLGMRGIHDSGFETEAFRGLTGEELKQAKIDLLQTVITDQQKILKDTLNHDTMMTFVPYKEVLPLYDGGLQVPEDITLVWANDNYGYIRRYPSEKEKHRKGGNGIYYHNSYWAPPGMSYVFLCSIPLAHTANELRKAYAEGVRKLWVMNVGAMKPLEQEIEFFLRLAWEIDKANQLTEDVDAYVADWIDGNFSGGIGKETAGLLNDFSQLTNMRKVEMMDTDAFSQTAYGDEAAVRIHLYEKLFEKGNRLYRSLPQEEKDAFFQMVLMRIHAAYFTNLAYYYGDRSTLMYEQGKMQAAAAYVKKVRELEDARRCMVEYYNRRMAGGKWNGIVNPEGFPPPRAAMMPVCTPPLEIGQPGLRVSLWNGEESLVFTRPICKWLEIGNAGTGSVRFEITAPEWVLLSRSSGSVEEECRVLVTVRDVDCSRQGTIRVTDKTTGETREYGVSTLDTGAWRSERRKNVPAPEAGEDFAGVEDDGIICVGAAEASCPEFKAVKRLGRGYGPVLEVCAQHEPEEVEEQLRRNAPYPYLSYPVIFTSEGSFEMEIQRFPSLNSTGHIRIGVSVDGGEIQFAETQANDEHRGTWKENVRNNVDRLYVKLPYVKPGVHTLGIHGVDRYFAFSGFAVYTRERRANNFAGAPGLLQLQEMRDSADSMEGAGGAGNLDSTVIGESAAGMESTGLAAGRSQALPAEFDSRGFVREFYGEITLRPRPVEYAPLENPGDTLVVADTIRQDEEYGPEVSTEFYLGAGQKPFEETGCGICIDAATVLAGTENAYKTGEGWQHCSSESYGRSGLAMYIRNWAEKEQENPALNYRVKCSGGNYVLWILAKFGRKEEFEFDLGLDGRVLEKEELLNRGKFWRYEAEQIYRYLPVARLTLEEGEHLLSVYAKAAGMRFDRICLMKGETLPPTDAEWGKTFS